VAHRKGTPGLQLQPVAEFTLHGLPGKAGQGQRRAVQVMHATAICGEQKARLGVGQGRVANVGPGDGKL